MNHLSDEGYSQKRYAKEYEEWLADEKRDAQAGDDVLREIIEGYEKKD